ncbi:NUDIX domain-containing protein [Actinokineospora iranica]|uniref:ADP-ribose pyrophosphatase YjhB, NUDIX family n=1 Tax=Actinokineospora iranica TaxID=1271860 RepID=A0A1G6VS55_9PSEU|nr:NUDIX hydrolase [Actinokineospora iranica]SDD55807.1 ADP-ribose pyrophosphatase YjhB, NUDIX family [Actinokineospora iranica]
MDTPADSFATPRLAAGALFVRNDQVLLVRKTYGNRWDIPGGYVDRGESPAAACEREVREELGLNRTVHRLLVHDWAPNESEGDKVLYVFDCGELGEDENEIRVDGVEIDVTEWVSVNDLGDYLIPRLERRIAQAYRAYQCDVVLYLEHGRPRFLP